MALGLDLKPLERGMDALVRMAVALERMADLSERAIALAEEQQRDQAA